jgi:hypothetical protein
MQLYKYYPCNDNTFKSLEAKSLWCHSPSGMNDPFECLAQVKRSFSNEQIAECQNYIRQRGLKQYDFLLSQDASHFNAVFNSLRQNTINQWAFCALARKPDDILMWSYYANGHKGVVVGFEFKNVKDRRTFQRVRYRDELPDFDPKTLIDFLDGKPRLADFIRDISIKSNCWRREQEWRIWMLKSGYHSYSSAEVKSIYFGVNCDIETEFKVREALSYVDHGEFMKFKMVFKDKPIGLTYKLH